MSAAPRTIRFTLNGAAAECVVTQSSVEQFLVLLSVLQTCEYRKVNPLKFLLSGKRQLRDLEDFPIEAG